MVFLYTTLSLSFYKDVKPVLVLLLWITNQGWHFIAVTLRWCMSPNPDSGIRVVMAETRNFAKHWKCAVWKLKKKKKNSIVLFSSHRPSLHAKLISVNFWKQHQLCLYISPGSLIAFIFFPSVTSRLLCYVSFTVFSQARDFFVFLFIFFSYAI